MEKRRSCFLWWPIRFSKYTIEQTHSGDLELVTERGLIFKRIDKLKLYRINDLSYSRTFGNWICGVSNLVIHSSDKSTQTLRVLKIRRGRDFMDYLEHKIAAERQRVNIKYSETNII